MNHDLRHDLQFWSCGLPWLSLMSPYLDPLFMIHLIPVFSCFSLWPWHAWWGRGALYTSVDCQDLHVHIVVLVLPSFYMWGIKRPYAVSGEAGIWICARVYHLHAYVYLCLKFLNIVTQPSRQIKLAITASVKKMGLPGRGTILRARNSLNTLSTLKGKQKGFLVHAGLQDAVQLFPHLFGNLAQFFKPTWSHFHLELTWFVTEAIC